MSLDGRMSERGTIIRRIIWAGNLKRDMIALWLATRDRRCHLTTGLSVLLFF